MIDTQIFLKCITLLSNHYDRQLLPEVLPIWKEYCDQSLTTEQFQQAIKIAILESRFFPTAKELVETVKGNPELQALEEWKTCVKAASRADMSVSDSLTPAGKFALRSIGGVSELGRTNEDDLRWVLKEFVSSWKAWLPTVLGAGLPTN